MFMPAHLAVGDDSQAGFLLQRDCVVHRRRKHSAEGTMAASVFERAKACTNLFSGGLQMIWLSEKSVQSFCRVKG
jgi:hypothetical protein